ncbi:MAG: AAA family ATPase [Bacteroidales bacterium]
MIKKINHIKNFGVFNAYRRSGNIQDFEKVNIIYGWNYSGKTTISRVFQCFESCKLKEHYPQAEFELEDFEGNKGNQSNLNINNFEIKVFNSDFIKDNIHLEGERFNPILLLGEDTKKAQEELEKKNIKLGKVKTIISNLGKTKTNIDNEILSGLTQRASQIKETLQIVQAYTRAHIKPLFDEIKSDYKKHIKNDFEVTPLLKKATASENDKLPEKDDVLYELHLSELLSSTKELLKEIPEFSSTIQYLMDNPDIANWIEKGIPLHENKEKCEFCGNDLDKDRMTQLTAHFSEDLKRHKKSINDLISKIKEAKQSNPSYQKSDFYKNLWSDFEVANSSLKGQVAIYNKELGKLVKLLEKKFDNPFVPITDLSSINDNTADFNLSLSDYNQVVIKNRKITKDFQIEKDNAIDSLKKHYTAKFIDDIELEKKLSKIKLYENREANFGNYKVDLEQEIKKLESKVSKAHKGSEKLNSFIQKFLGRDEIRVDVEKEGEKERFRLKRKDTKAVNLSEGEKTAIAFSFFLTKLLECNDLKKVIVFIDDPISSLDSNHIFQVNSVIKDFFFSKENPEDVNPKILNCKQLFLSTHNFDFFNLLRELPNPKDGNKFYYFVKRINENESLIDKLPKSIKNYSSEYHYLFELIYTFNNQANKDIDLALILPNAVRRFVELYTYSRIPGDENNSVDNRAEKLWGSQESKRILKVCHYFSHGNNIVRMGKHNEYLCDIENAVADLISLLSKDTFHFTELKKIIK